ncbi:MAG TPA: hypothetical protein VFZ25_10650 [Chloroflexota bacterium]|nr:hypothetical protein [Chloroflexota bacterium]
MPAWTIVASIGASLYLLVVADTAVARAMFAEVATGAGVAVAAGAVGATVAAAVGAAVACPAAGAAVGAVPPLGAVEDGGGEQAATAAVTAVTAESRKN